jgi:hypothetical protein
VESLPALRHYSAAFTSRVQHGSWCRFLCPVNISSAASVKVASTRVHAFDNTHIGRNKEHRRLLG